MIQAVVFFVAGAAVQSVLVYMVVGRSMIRNSRRWRAMHEAWMAREQARAAEDASLGPPLSYYSRVHLN